ncbi:MAG: hypothetical protein B7Z78_03125 [Rhodospirillales bacterium 20-60-12]|nr:MAG: hypothetical protein B7Z78_03125 [Rhodospirillales bacterium 20-60-12]
MPAINVRAALRPGVGKSKEEPINMRGAKHSVMHNRFKPVRQAKMNAVNVMVCHVPYAMSVHRCRN